MIDALSEDWRKESIERLLTELDKTPAMKLVEIVLLLNGSVESRRGGRDEAQHLLARCAGVSRSTVEKALKRMREQGRIVALDAGYRYQEGE